MAADLSPHGWRVLKQSVIGATHKRQSLQNQDALASWQAREGGVPIILAVADGHGSAKSFRSEIGARYAVQEAIAILEEISKDFPSQIAAEQLDLVEITQNLVASWQKQVTRHLLEKPLSPTELESLETSHSWTARQSVENNQFIAYGTTLLSVLVTEQYVLYWQLGDGDILCVDQGGKTERPLNRDTNLIANETYSLCMDNAAKKFQTRLVPITLAAPSPSLILLSTDGYANSFVQEADFLKIGKDYQTMIREQGCEQVQEQLEHFLSETSRAGSGDDITLGIIKKLDENDLVDYLKLLHQRLYESQKEVEQLKDKIRELEESLEEKVNREVQQLFTKLGEYQQKNQHELDSMKQNLETKYLEIQTEQSSLHQHFIWLHRALIATFCLGIISIISNLALWFSLPRTSPALSSDSHSVF
jgi:serine/threonine protein phosphatase PrpC